ncbi:MAG: T9SS type A sorting domain-containing protein [Flavobacteriales bacterium]|nr:T9SS type A sorting domain-containing protein [Flavobacteriales bacterium]
MKKLYIVTLLSILIGSASAQVAKDIAAVGITNPDTTMNVPANWSDTLKLLVANVGTDTIPMGDTVPVTITLQGFPLNPINFVMSQDLPPLFGLNLLISGIDLTPLNLSDGDTVAICFTVNYAPDGNANNNQYCFTYTIGTNNTSVWDSEMNAFDFFARGKELVFVNRTSPIQVMVTNQLGQIIVNESNFTGNLINLEQTNSGIYIVNTIENGERKTKKVYIK